MSKQPQFMKSRTSGKPYLRLNQRFFTLTELVVVTIIIVLISGLAIGRIGQMPAFATLDAKGADVCNFLRRCGMYATGSGREIRVGCDPENRKFYVIEYMNINNNNEAVYSEQETAFAHIVDLGDSNDDRSIKTEAGTIKLPEVGELKIKEITLPETIQVIIPETFDTGTDETKDEAIELDAGDIEKVSSEMKSISIDSASSPDIMFRFYPDGAAAGGPVLLRLGGHAVEILASPLTGAVTMREVNLQEYAQKYRIEYDKSK